MNEKFNPDNERIKRNYFDWLKHADQKNEKTISNVRKSLVRFENSTGFDDFRNFNIDQAIGFKTYLYNLRAVRSGTFLSRSSIVTTTRDVKKFFKWLCLHTGFKKIVSSELEYFNLSEKELMIAKAPKIPQCPDLEIVKRLILTMPNGTVIERRNQALIAFTLLTGLRDSAICSLKLKHIELDVERVNQLPAEGVKTKYGKTIYTYFFQVGNQIKQIVIDWINYLRQDRGFQPDDPVFPRTKAILNRQKSSFEYLDIEPICWANADPIRKIFKEAFRNGNLEYFNPHLFRNTLTRLGQKICTSPEELKAWSQNLGHEKVLTTFSSYGNIDPITQGTIIRRLSARAKKDDPLSQINEKLDYLVRNKTNLEGLYKKL